MNDGIPDDMWTPYKHLQSVIETSILRPGKTNLSQLEVILRKSKQNFASLLKNPPRNELSRIAIKKGVTEGINVPGTGNVVLSKDLVDESIIISDMYNLDENNALELLCTAQQQMIHHPGLPRGLVAVLLYYDGRKALVTSLRDLFQVRAGVSWCSETSKELIHLITGYTDSLVAESNVLCHIIDILSEMDITKELEILTKNRALGPPKHHRQVLDLFEDIQLALATALFNWSAQCGLPKNVTEKLIDHLSKYKATESRGGIDKVTLTLLMALLYAFDTSILQRHEDIERSVQNLPIICEKDFALHIYNLLKDSNWEWDNKLKSIVSFAFGLSMATLRHAPQNLKQNSEKIIEYDEDLVDDAILYKVFDFIHYILLENELVYKTEFFYRRIHTLFTDFIDNMHSKVTELRGRADETARTVQSFAQQGLDSPPNLDRNFESLMLAVGKLYIRDDLNLNLCLEYWGPMEIQTNYSKSTPRSVSLFKFIRLAGELLPPILFVPYMKMLSGLSSSENAARCAFNLLKQGSGLTNSTTISWDHFFGSLCRYYANLRQEQGPGTDTIYRNRALNRSINPQEIEGLHAVLEIVKVVANYDEIARVSLCEHPSWAPLHVLIGLLSCSVPINLKADIVLTLAALGKSRDTATQLWNNLEASQIIRTIPTTSVYCNGGLEAEIEQNESRNEFYPLTVAVLKLLDTLVSVGVPKNLGAGPRKPGLDPYLNFIVDTIFLKFYNRNYKNIAEKWKVGEACLKVLYHFIKSYNVNPIDFVEKKEENSPPGYHLMLQLNTKSDLLRLVLHIIDEARNGLDAYAPFPGKIHLETSALYCLKIMEKTLSLQDLFFEAHSIANSSILLSGLNKLILDVNPRSGKPDHILNTTKFVTYNNWLPEHSLVAVKILNLVAKQPNINAQILGMLGQTEKMATEICHGFVECFENDVFVEDDKESENIYGDIQLGIKEAIIKLIQDTLLQPSPNIALFLLGFDVNKDFRNTHMQKTGSILTSSNNCTRSLVSMLDKNLELIKSGITVNTKEENIVEKAYGLLYTLCSNQITFHSILRYLRSCNDFLCRHIAALPFQNYTSSKILNQMSFLLKCIAIELKITADNNQVSQFSNLCKILLGVVQSNLQENIPFELSQYLSTTFTDQSISDSLIINKRNPSDQQTARILLCHLLDCLEFQMKQIQQPEWHFFDNSLTISLLNDCEVANKDVVGPKLIDIRKLHDILIDELNTVQSSIVAGQRQLIMEEIESFLKYAVKVNEQKKSCVATIKFVEAWGQVTEILFSVSPNFALPRETKHDLILEILQCLLNKVVPVEVMMELANITSATILILMVNLRSCYNNSIKSGNMSENSDKFHGLSLQPTTKNMGTQPKSNTLSLKYILQNLLEWIVLSGVGSQKLRINLYASLLNFMHIVKENIPKKEASNESEFFVSRLDSSMANFYADSGELNQVQMVVEVFSNFGEKIVDILCHDCIGGPDICKMLALSCIDSLLDMDSFTNFINFIAKRGYLTHLIDSLLKADDGLCRVLKAVPDDMKALYVYESKMATLCRIAGTHVGAELLLENRVLGTLSNMKVFDLHPDFQVNPLRRHEIIDTSSFVPPVEKRYQQILFPALNLCDCIISTLGSENHSAVSQVLHFLLSHSETIEIVLRTGNPCSRLELLQELAGITGLIARSANQETSLLQELNLDQEVGAHLYRLQRLMLSLFPRFILNENTLKEMAKVNTNLYEENEKSEIEKNKSLHVKYFLETACNLTMYCRNIIANHSADHRTTSILFSPSVTESALNRTDYRGNTLEITPSLGIVVNQLKYSVEYYNREKLMYDKLVRQKAALPSISLDSSIQSQNIEILQKINEKQSELNYCTFITEQCLYLLWAHLDFYMKRSIPINKLQLNAKSLMSGNESFISSPSEAGWKISSEDISILKKNLITVFNETFCKQLVATQQSQNTSDRGFTEGLMRRIKCLVQFVPVN